MPKEQAMWNRSLIHITYKYICETAYTASGWIRKCSLWNAVAGDLNAATSAPLCFRMLTLG